MDLPYSFSLPRIGQIVFHCLRSSPVNSARVCQSLEYSSRVSSFAAAASSAAHEHQLIQFRGLRLYKSKSKKTAQQQQEDEAKLRRQEQQKHELERLRDSRRVSIGSFPTIIPALPKGSSDDLTIRSRTDSSIQSSRTHLLALAIELGFCKLMLI
jgi:hypothetical protein